MGVKVSYSFLVTLQCILSIRIIGRVVNGTSLCSASQGGSYLQTSEESGSRQRQAGIGQSFLGCCLLADASL